MVSGGMTCVKYLLYVFNLLFVISGIALIVIGALSITLYKGNSTFTDAKFATGPLLFIVVGSIIFVIAFFGCCGAIKENHCMIVTFSVLLLTIFCIQLAAGICGYVYRKDVKNGIEQSFQKMMPKYESDKDIKNAWDFTQHDLQCCGVEGPKDWLDKGMPIPASCCRDSESRHCNIDNAYKRGCSTALKYQMERFALIIGGFAIGIAFIQLVGVIFACCLAKSIRKEYETV